MCCPKIECMISLKYCVNIRGNSSHTPPTLLSSYQIISGSIDYDGDGGSIEIVPTQSL